VIDFANGTCYHASVHESGDEILQYAGRSIATMAEIYKSDMCSPMGVYALIGEKIGQKLQDRSKAKKNK